MPEYKKNGSARALRAFITVITCLVFSPFSMGSLPPYAFHGEGIDIAWGLESSFAYDDNFYQDDRRKNAGIYTITPNIYAQAESGPNSYGLGVELNHHQYTIINAEPATDYQLNLDVYHEFTRRNRFSGSIVAGQYVDEGQELTGNQTLPQYQQLAANGTYGFGSLKTRARLDFFGNLTKKKYKSVQYENSETSLYGAMAYVRFLTRTDILFEVSKEDLGYSGTGTTDYGITSYLTGLSFRPSAKTAGFFKLGRRYRSSEGNESEGYTGWDIGASYNLKSYSVIQLSAGEKYDIDSDDPAQSYFAKATTISLEWNHQWSSRRKTVIGWEGNWEDVLGCGGKPLKETITHKYHAGWAWEVRRWLTVSLNWEHTLHHEKARQPDADLGNYRQNVFTLTGSITL